MFLWASVAAVELLPQDKAKVILLSMIISLF